MQQVVADDGPEAQLEERFEQQFGSDQDILLSSAGDQGAQAVEGKL